MPVRLAAAFILLLFGMYPGSSADRVDVGPGLDPAGASEAQPPSGIGPGLDPAGGSSFTPK